jgi:hypothetical protein
VETKSIILPNKFVAVVKFTPRNDTTLAVVTSTMTQDTPNVVITSQSNPKRQNALATESKLVSLDSALFDKIIIMTFLLQFL